LVADVVLGLNNEVDELEELGLGPYSEEGKILKHFHLLQFTLLNFGLENVLKALFIHDGKVAISGAFDSGGSKHRLVVLKQGLLTESVTS
jgi:hypothetical protein